MTTELLIGQLVDFAQASNTDIAELLRRSKTIATKLGADDARSWIDSELNGYSSDDTVPQYRTVPSELRIKNPFHGWGPVVWESSNRLQEHFASAEIRFAVAQIIEISNRDGEPATSLNQSEMNVLTGLNDRFATLPSARFFSRADFIGILDAIRTRILGWALEMEQKLKFKQSTEPQQTEERMTHARPRMFIGSTTEALTVARAVQSELDNDLEITLWNQNVFEPGNSTWNELVELARGNKYDFALIVLGAEDEVTSRGTTSKAPRDNVLLELGLFAGAIGPKRTFFLVDRDKKPKIASDLAGITALHYIGTRSDGVMQRAVGPACEQIRQRVEALKRSAVSP